MKTPRKKAPREPRFKTKPTWTEVRVKAQKDRADLDPEIIVLVAAYMRAREWDTEVAANKITLIAGHVQGRLEQLLNRFDLPAEKADPPGCNIDADMVNP